jgi:phage shock protein PspC (stress-responsive transcriptional regulator)
MNRIKAFGGFWYDFIVGDDWRVAVAVVAGLAISFGVARTAVPAWWVLPVTVAIVLPLSLWRIARTRQPGRPGPTVEDVDRPL